MFTIGGLSNHLALPLKITICWELLTIVLLGIIPIITVTIYNFGQSAGNQRTLFFNNDLVGTSETKRDPDNLLSEDIVHVMKSSLFPFNFNNIKLPQLPPITIRYFRVLEKRVSILLLTILLVFFYIYDIDAKYFYESIAIRESIIIEELKITKDLMANKENIYYELSENIELNSRVDFLWDTENEANDMFHDYSYVGEINFEDNPVISANDPNHIWNSDDLGLR
jgi:hypothetical protein